MWRGSLLVLLALAQDDEQWREDLGLHKTGQEQRRAAHWLADLDQAINFDLDTLATDHALRRSQISEEGWVATHATWLMRRAWRRPRSTRRSAGPALPVTIVRGRRAPRSPAPREPMAMSSEMRLG